MQHPSHLPQRSNPNSSDRSPEVADREPTPECPGLNASLNPRTEELEDLPSFKVFLKKNLPYQAPPQDLLANIYRRIGQIKAEQA